MKAAFPLKTDVPNEMILHNKIRLLALVVAACAVGLIIYMPIKAISLKDVEFRVNECERAQDTGMETKTCTDALETLNTAVSRYSDDVQTAILLRNRAWVKYVLGDLDGSKSDTNEAVKLDPNSAWAWYLRGRLNMLTGDPETAIADYRKSSDIDHLDCPTNRRIREMTWVLWKLGKEGPSALDEIIEKKRSANPVDADLAFVEYLSDSKSGPYSRAKDFLDLLIQSTDRPEYLMLLRARINARMNLYEQALEELDTLTNNSELYDKISEQMRAKIQELEAAGNSCAADQFSLQNRMYLYLYSESLQLEFDLQKDLENWEGALSSVDEMIAYRPQEHMPWTKRGEMLESLGRADEALTSYKEAIRLGRPENYNAAHGTASPLIEALFRLSHIYDTQNRSAEAPALWNESLSVAGKSVIKDVQEMMEIAGHYEGEQTGIFDENTKNAVRACLDDAQCNWSRLNSHAR